jgi:AraC-like DNA-binding protein
MVSGDRVAGDNDSTLTLSLSREALGALDAYLQSGAARGLPFEQPLLQALGARRPPSAPTVLSRRTLRKVHEFIAANLASDFRVADIARAAFLSPYHLGRRYHEATGRSLWQYVLQCRAEHARRLIAQEQHTTLADIAAASGFQSYGQFIAAFRKCYGTTPGAYRDALERVFPQPAARFRSGARQRAS